MNVKSQKVTSGSLMTNDQQRIYYDHYQNGFEKVIILAHGFFNSRKAILLRKMALTLSDEYDVISFDFRGHGESQGLYYWTAKEYLDLESILNYAQESYNKIGAIGFSLGAAASLIAVPKISFMQSLIVVSAPVQFGKIDFHFWELDVEENILYNLIGQGRIGKGVRPGPFWLKKENPIDCVAAISIPVFFIHGEDDWLIKPWHSQELFHKKILGEKRLEIIPSGTHAEYLFRRDPSGIIQLFKTWFKFTL